METNHTAKTLITKLLNIRLINLKPFYC